MVEATKPLTVREVIKEFESLFPSPEEEEQIESIATTILNSNAFTKFKSTDVIKIILYKARALKIDPTQAMNHINVFMGKVTASAELQLFLILRQFPFAIQDLGWKGDGSTDQSCYYIVMRRPGMVKAKGFKWTMGQAKQAGLLGKDMWKKYTKDMLRSRCVSQMARSMYPDIIEGLSYTPEDFDGHFNGKTLEVEWETSE